jgi:predicted ATP-dependent endonuclease of OLD family
LEEQLINWQKLIEKLEALYISTSNENNSSKTNPNPDRLNYIIRDILKIENFISVNPFEGIKVFIESKFKEAIDKIQSRPTSLFIDELNSVFDNGDLPSKFEVLEFNNLIVSLEKDHLSIPYSIQNTIYIDTPMMISVEDTHNIHWDDLNELLLKKANIKNRYSEIISKEIIQGDVEFDETIYSAEDFKFKRTDGAIFNLLDVATGIKAFSILQMLLKNGSLSDKTLLVIDEPESNLHPQWIIEYARIIVLLNKEMGINFFLASHNPDFVSAIRYIAEKEGTLNKVNFYLAKKGNIKFKYNYTHLGTEIDPIFESFNIAIDKINRYGI